MPDRTPPSRHQHNPIIVSTRPRCPVCNAEVYSLAGIHPQCSERRHDSLEKASRKAALLATPEVPVKRSSWDSGWHSRHDDV